MTITAEQAAKLLEGTTDGPWRAIGSNICVGRGLRPRHLLKAWRTWDNAGNETTDVNAKLSAAAPDLARALITSNAARKLAEERLAKAVEGLSALNRAAGEVARQGAVTGPQWTRLNVALLKSRATLMEIDND